MQVPKLATAAKVSSLERPYPHFFISPLHSLPLPVVNCDSTASSAPCPSVESFVRSNVLPTYANTHTLVSHCSAQTTAFVAEARNSIAECCKASVTGKASKHVVLFTGSGTTGAVSSLIDCCGFSAVKEPKVVITGPWEHHSNMIPWREAGFDVVPCPTDPSNNVDVEGLSALCFGLSSKYSLKIGSFSAASNITGQIQSNMDELNALLKSFGFLHFVDFATAGPYLQIDASKLDAAFISPHKFYGGPGSSGVLVASKSLVSQTLPVTRNGGGGTVFYVTSKDHRFHSSRVDRWEGGTPNILGNIRAGLAFVIKRQLGESLHVGELRRKDRGLSYFADHCPNLVLLDKTRSSLPIFPFLVRCGTRFLHYNFVSTLLSDLFGIQTRGGCMCSGPYAQLLLGMTNSAGDPTPGNRQVEAALLDKNELLRPGFTRFSLPFYLSDEAVEYVLRAVRFVCEHGHAFLLSYRCDLRRGEWRHKSRVGKPLGANRKWLNSIDLSASCTPEGPNADYDESAILSAALANAESCLSSVLGDKSGVQRCLERCTSSGLPAEYEHLRWFVYPREAAEMLKSGKDNALCSNDDLQGVIRPITMFPTDQDHFGEQQGHAAAAAELPRLAPHLERRDDEQFMFKNGETHTGSATREEISEGFDEGELDNSCIVYINEEGSWVGVEEFLSSVTGDASVPYDAGKEHPPLSAVAYSKKKPSRDSSVWGSQDNVVAVAVATNPPRETSHQAAAARPRSSSPKSESPSKCFLPRATATAANTASKSVASTDGATVKLPKKLMKKIGEAIMQWKMIKDGDRLLLGLSGGKDSLTLLHALLDIQRRAPVKFDLACCTVDPLTPSFDPSPLIPYVESLGLKYFYKRDNIIENAKKAGKDGGVVKSLCSFCARMKRGILYSTARDNGYNKLVLAQHLDDCAESFLMSAVHNGLLRTMKAHYKVGESSDDLSVIRPLIYVRESVMRDYALAANLPVINENCPACFEDPKERARIKKLLSKEENLTPALFDNMRTALLPLMDKDISDSFRTFTNAVIDRGRKQTKDAPRKINGKIAPAQDFDLSERTLSMMRFTDEELEAELKRRRRGESRSGEKAAGVPTPPSLSLCSLNGGDKCEIFE